MLSYTTRYIEKNGGLMLQRKFLGIWWDYQLHANKIISVQEELNNIAHKAESEVAKLNALREEEYRIWREIKASKSGMTQEAKAKMKMRPLRHKAKTLADQSWTELVKLFGAGGTIANVISGIPGARVTEVNHYSVGEQISESADDEFVGSKEFPVRPQQKQQQKQKGQNNNQQQSQ